LALASFSVGFPYLNYTNTTGALIRKNNVQLTGSNSPVSSDTTVNRYVVAGGYTYWVGGGNTSLRRAPSQ